MALVQVRKFEVTNKITGQEIGKAEYRLHGAGFSSGIEDPKTWEAVERAVYYIISEPGCCGLTMQDGLSINQVD